MKLFEKPPGVSTRWASFENPLAEKGRGGQKNRQAKGNAFEALATGETKVLLDVQGSGTVNRIWLTLSDRSPEVIQALTLKMYWEGCAQAAVEVPLSDFFGIAWGRKIAWESEFFSDPQGKSFNCLIPMPFRRAARITVTNNSAHDIVHLFYDVNFTLGEAHLETMHYFHASWRRENPNQLGQDFTVLPKIEGSGRFLGCNFGITTSPEYKNSWWGEGEFKVFLDGDTEFPTLCGTGVEDYIGAAWCQSLHQHRFQGCTIADQDLRQWCLYRFHVPDPIYFAQDCCVRIQTIGGCRPFSAFKELQLAGARVIATSLDLGAIGAFYRLLDGSCTVNLDSKEIQLAWVNFYRQDDWVATAYYYLNRPD